MIKALILLSNTGVFAMPNRRNDGRPVVGPADLATQRKMRDQYDADAKTEARDRMAKKSATVKEAITETATEAAQTAVEQGYRNKTTGQLNNRRQRIDQVVDAAVKGS